MGVIAYLMIFLEGRIQFYLLLSHKKRMFYYNPSYYHLIKIKTYKHDKHSHDIHNTYTK
jgi:hypothetical protein